MTGDGSNDRHIGRDQHGVSPLRVDGDRLSVRTWRRPVVALNGKFAQQLFELRTAEGGVDARRSPGPRHVLGANDLLGLDRNRSGVAAPRQHSPRSLKAEFSSFVQRQHKFCPGGAFIGNDGPYPNGHGLVGFLPRSKGELVSNRDLSQTGFGGAEDCVASCEGRFHFGTVEVACG
jgi:hypothetical protein